MVIEKREKWIDDWRMKMTIVLEIWLQGGAWRSTAEYGPVPVGRWTKDGRVARHDGAWPRHAVDATGTYI